MNHRIANRNHLFLWLFLWGSGCISSNKSLTEGDSKEVSPKSTRDVQVPAPSSAPTWWLQTQSLSYNPKDMVDLTQMESIDIPFLTSVSNEKEIIINLEQVLDDEVVKALKGKAKVYILTSNIIPPQSVQRLATIECRRISFPLLTEVTTELLEAFVQGE